MTTNEQKMCGFVGLFDIRQKSDALRTQVLKMSKNIRHRGPDWSGVYCGERAILSHERLSIVDPQSGGQPLFSRDGKLVLAVNGEIYNHREIRDELAGEYDFRTGSDCEVILPLYQKMGVGLLEKISGIFAFALYDIENDEYLIARDPIGVIPLYIGWDRDEQFYVASELKALEGVCTTIQPFLPGHYWSSKEGKMVRWYDRDWFEYDAVKETGADIPALRAALEAAVKRQLMSDVPYGVLLSGGLDSSIISAVARKFADRRVESHDRDRAWWPRLHSFAIGLEGSPDLAAARKVADRIGTVHHEIHYTIQEGLDALRDVIYFIETYDVTTVRASTPMYLLARVIKSMGIKMVLSGEGADELFGGYWIYHDQFEFDKYFKVPRPLRAAAGAVAEKLPSFHGRRFAMRGSGGPEKSYQRASMNYMWDEIPNVLKDYDGPCKPWEWCKPHFDEAAKQNLDIITQTQYVDMVSYMPFDICLKADKMSMSQSLELRVPFLDKKVLDVALQLPTACRVDDDHAKYALRVAASKLGFQKKVANMPKQPFITPLTVWLQTDLYYDRIKEAFTSEAAHEFFNVDYLVQMLDDHKSADFSTVEGRGKLKMMRIWNIYCFLCWYEVFFGKSSEQLKPKTQVA